MRTAVAVRLTRSALVSVIATLVTLMMMMALKKNTLMKTHEVVPT